MGGGASKKSNTKADSIKPPPPASAPLAPEGAAASEPESPAKIVTPKASPESVQHDAKTLPTPKDAPQAEVKEPSESSPRNTSDDEAFARMVGEAFGPRVLESLISSKWDRKVEALKNINEVVKRKLVLPSKFATEAEKQKIEVNTATCFHAACMVLKRSACDKILPVLLASHELLRGIFQQAINIIQEEKLLESLNDCLAQVWSKIGDSNIRLHDSAKSTIVFAAGLRFYRTSLVLERLQALISEKHRGHMRAKQISGVVDTVCSLVEHFPGTTSSSWNPQMWSMEQISPFIASGLDDVVGPRTRIGAVKLAGAAFSKLGREAMNPLLGTLRPAVRNLLLQKFDELEKSPDEPEIEDVPDVEVIEAKPSVIGSAKPPLSKSITTSMAKSNRTAKPPPTPNFKPTPRPAQNDAAIIKAPATPKVQSSPSPRPTRFSPTTPFIPNCPPQLPPQPKWKSAIRAEEEDIMDQILEETGLAFGNGEKLAVGLDEEIDNLGMGGMAISCC